MRAPVSRKTARFEAFVPFVGVPSTTDVDAPPKSVLFVVAYVVDVGPVLVVVASELLEVFEPLEPLEPFEGAGGSSGDATLSTRTLRVARTFERRPDASSTYTSSDASPSGTRVVSTEAENVPDVGHGVGLVNS